MKITNIPLIGPAEKPMYAYREGVRMYRVGRNGQGGVSWPWMGHTHGVVSRMPGEIGAAMIWEWTGKDTNLARWAVK